MLESADDGGKAEDAVDVEHHRGEHGVARQRRVRFARQQHHQDHHFHRHGGERQDQGAVGLAQAHRQHFGMMRDAEGDADDGRQDDQQQSPERCAAVIDGTVFERKAEREDQQRDSDG